MTSESQPADGVAPDSVSSESAGGAQSRPLIERWLADHGDVLWRFALARTRSRDAAEEVVQDTLVAAIQAMANFAGTSSERTWLLGIAAHKIADHFRARRRALQTNARPGAASEEGESEMEGAAFTPAGRWARLPAAWGLGADDAAETAEVLAALRGCIEGLPPSQAEVVWMRDLLSIPSDEVCKVTGITPTNLWSRLHRARAALRACVERSLGRRQEGSR